MSDVYQATHDALRVRLGNCDVGSAVESAAREAFGMANHHMACVAQYYAEAAYEQKRPSVLFKPSLSIDGNQWCALYGLNLQDGIAGFGHSPEEAMANFDIAWSTKLEGRSDG